MKWKWRRVRPGLYQVRRRDGAYVGLIERGAETGRWWWEAYAEGDWVCGGEITLAEAKFEAQRILGPT